MAQGPRKGKMKPSPKAKTIATIPGVMYKGSGKDPAVNELRKKLKKELKDLEAGVLQQTLDIEGVVKKGIVQKRLEQEKLRREGKINKILRD